MRKITLDPPRSVTRNQLIAKRASLKELERKQWDYYAHCSSLTENGRDPDLVAARSQWIGTNAQIKMLDELLGGAA